MKINEALELLERYGYSVENPEDIKQQIILLKQHMYKLEDEAERLQLRARSVSRISSFSRARVYEDDVDLATQARKKRMEARQLARQIQELQRELV